MIRLSVHVLGWGFSCWMLLKGRKHFGGKHEHINNTALGLSYWMCFDFGVRRARCVFCFSLGNGAKLRIIFEWSFLWMAAAQNTKQLQQPLKYWTSGKNSLNWSTSILSYCILTYICIWNIIHSETSINLWLVYRLSSSTYDSIPGTAGRSHHHGICCSFGWYHRAKSHTNINSDGPSKAKVS